MRISRGALVWGLTLVLLGALLLAQQQGWIGVPIPFWAWVFGGLGVLCLLTALTNRSLWGMLFPGFVLLGLGVVVFLSTSTSASGNVIGAIFLGSIALPFWIVALVRRSNWWAIIPAGVVTVLAIMPLLAEARVSGQIVGAVFFLGLGATFALVRLWTIGQRGMSWAWYPALILGGLGLVVLATGNPQAWPLVLIAIGAVLLIRALMPSRRPPMPPPSPPSPVTSIEPEAKG
ncbi:MAG: hypothetical protein ACRDGG_12485 [Anaerolineae bacterium]